ncbi:EF-hand domain-containing family member B-like [Gigantopelta aegis]|uniref:EF-hand domain-containing family member B-like n=1 Tax=Gigantopelta aegis TaxID=1735272 RepID=UPI001B887E03|nr:EF-hand domain-containing family member B-like [Gigantopelta aegis]
MTTKVRFPDIPADSVYQGKYKDWTPELRAAGKLTALSGDSVSQCMKTPKRPESPPVIRRFRDTFEPEAGAIRVFYGKALDPHRDWAAKMVHGISYRQGNITAGKLLNPFPKTLFRQKLLDKKENIYNSHIRAPLGESHDQRPGLPSRHHSKTFTFGIRSKVDSGAGTLINPDKTYAEVEEETNVGHPMYVKTHVDYHPGERIQRSYTSPGFCSTNKFGIPTPHTTDGRNAKRTLRWLHETNKEKATQLVGKRLDDFLDRYQYQLGKVRDPIKDTMLVPEDHIFGLYLKPDEYSAGDLIHNRVPGEYLRGKDRQRALVATIRHNLKKLNYHNFQDLLSAFKFYDKSGCGKISLEDLREACIQFQLPAEPELLEQLVDTCDVDRDGLINYIEFCNFLNWKDKMPSGFPDVPEHCKTSSEETKQGDLVPKSPQSNESTPRRLQKQIDKAIGNHHTSAQMINAVVGGVDTRDYRKYGVPTVRIDIAAPRIRRINDRTNYGNESDAWGLLNPSLFSQKGVYEVDLLVPRTIEEIKEIMENIGVYMTGETLHKLYKYTAENHPKGDVSVESFRTTLDQLDARDIVTGKHKMAV